jgi:allantoin racemase
MLTGELLRRENILKEIALRDTQIDIFGLEEDPTKSHLGTIQSSYEASLATIEDLKCAKDAEKAGYQAIIIPCGNDPGVAALREILNIPVVPPGSTAKHFCSLISPRFSVLTTGKGKSKNTLIHERDGLMKHVSIHPVGLSVPELRSNPKKAYEAMVHEGHNAIINHRAGAITFGCMSIGFLMIDEKLNDELGIPVINPVKVSVRIAEIMIDFQLVHSKIAYPIPPSFLGSTYN